MEQNTGPQAVNPHLRRVLKSFQTASVRSLSGPNGLSIVNDLSKMSVDDYRKVVASVKKCIPSDKGVDYDPFLAPPPFPIQQMPVFTPVDTSRSDKADTILEGEMIACFLVGGERRLCLPQILNTVLRDFTLQQINAVCDELHIFCSRCNPEQLDTLKVTGILPLSAPSCGLITKTDAERLCNALLHGNPEKFLEPPSPNSFKVYHECFGKCKGVFNPELYNNPEAKCIQCADCHGLFSPPKFVCHSHKALENRTCHWGFDSANWRSYLLLTKDQECREQLQLIKARFDPGNKYKRKQSPDRDVCEGKRLKGEESLSPSSVPWTEHPSGVRAVSAFQPWSPSVLAAIKEGKLLPAPPAIMRDGLPGILPSYLHTGPPVLLNPERVVPYSESERYERHFTPNVALAPPSQQKIKTEVMEEDTMTPCPLKKLAVIADSQMSPPSKDYHEYDLPTDTDDSSLGQSSPSDGEDAHLSESQCPESSLEAELHMIRRALDGKVPSTKEGKDGFLHEFSKLRTRQEELLNSLTQTKKSLKQELGSCKGRIRESAERRRSLQKEIERIRIESECRLHEAEEQKEKLMKEIDHLKNREESEVCEKFVQMNQDLKARLQHFESIYRDVQEENTVLRDELKRRGIDIVELLAKNKHQNCNGNSELKSQIVSPKNRLDLLKKLDGFQGWSPKRLSLKKERENLAE